MDYYQREKEAAARVAELLERPIAAEPMVQSVEDFDPWDLFPCVYGSYSSDFDEAMLDVLTALNLAANDNWDEAFAMQRKEGLAHRIFREMLCNAELCDYGTSPRSCFATTEFSPLLPRLIGRWKEYYAMKWGEAA